MYIANKIKTNLCLVLNQFFIVRPIPCATFNDLTEKQQFVLIVIFLYTLPRTQ